jgi:hypothetical protein
VNEGDRRLVRVTGLREKNRSATDGKLLKRRFAISLQICLDGGFIVRRHVASAPRNHGCKYDKVYSTRLAAIW